MNKQIAEGIKKAHELGRLSPQGVRRIVHNAVSREVRMVDGMAVDANEIANEAVSTAIETLDSVEGATKERIETAIAGTILGISKGTKETIEEIEVELLAIKYRLEEQKERLAVYLKDTFDGISEASVLFSETIKAEMEDVVTEVKLENIEMLGLMEETISYSVKAIIKGDDDVYAKVLLITQEATENALRRERLSAKRSKEVAEAAIMAAIEAAEEEGSHILEATKAAIEGTQAGIVTIIEEHNERITQAKERLEDLVEEDIKQIVEDLDAIESGYIEALGNASHQVDKIAKELLQECILERASTLSNLKESVDEAANVAIEYLKETGSESSYRVGEDEDDTAEELHEEILALSEKMVEIEADPISNIVENKREEQK